MTDHVNASWEWQPNGRTLLAWNALGLGLVLVGISAFTGLYSLRREDDANFAFSGMGALLAFLLTLLLIAVLMLLHEWIHGLVMRRFGAHPTFGRGVAAGAMPYLYCTAKGHLFSKWQFLIVALAPSVVISAVCALAIMLPSGGWLVVPAAVHLGGCIGDFWVSGIVAQKPDDMRFDDTITGVRFHEPD